jgi:hypothetical protein
MILCNAVTFTCVWMCVGGVSEGCQGVYFPTFSALQLVPVELMITEAFRVFVSPKVFFLVLGFFLLSNELLYYLSSDYKFCPAYDRPSIL